MFGSFMPSFGRGTSKAASLFGNQGGQQGPPQNNMDAFGRVGSAIGQNFGRMRNPQSPGQGMGWGQGGRFGGFGGGFNPGMDKGFGPPQQNNFPFMPRLIDNDEFQKMINNFRGGGQQPFQPQPGQDIAQPQVPGWGGGIGRALGPLNSPWQMNPGLPGGGMGRFGGGGFGNQSPGYSSPIQQLPYQGRSPMQGGDPGPGWFGDMMRSGKIQTMM